MNTPVLLITTKQAPLINNPEIIGSSFFEKIIKAIKTKVEQATENKPIRLNVPIYSGINSLSEAVLKAK